MFRRIFTANSGILSVSLLLAWGAILPMVASAQEYASPAKRTKSTPSLLKQLDNLGQQIVGAILPADPKHQADQHSRHPAKREATRRHNVMGPSPPTRPGSILTPTKAAGRPAEKPQGAPKKAVARVARPPRPTPAGRVVAASNRPSNPHKASAAAARPLHERLNAFRHSAFSPKAEGADTNKKPAPVSTVKKPDSNPSARVPQTASEKKPTLAPSRRAAESLNSRLTGRSTPPRTDSGRTVVRAIPAVPAPALGTNVAATQARNGALLVGKSPVLNVETVGPRRITVGKSSAYEVRIKNSGEVAADEVVVLVNLPLWADLMTSQTSVGTATTSQTDTSQPLRWAVGRLDAGASGKLALKIVPRESRPFDLAVRWDYRPVVSETMIEVQEPKLMLQVEGPRDVLYGDREVFKVKLTNTGNGDAENVKISLRSGGDNDDQAVSQNLGHLPPGQQKTIKVELTPRQAGNLMIDVGVTADNGVHAELTETILVRRASLQAAMQGPAMQYVGAAVDYRLLVRNTGNANAKNVNMIFNLPATVEYISGISDATVSDDGGRLLWTLPNLPPSGEKEFLIRCRLAAAGKKMFKVVSATEDGLSDSVSVFTQVKAIADLVLEVKDPGGPVAVGNRATYELHIKNRGSKSAERIEVVTYFSNGIEPTAAEGGEHKIRAGQVVFQPIASVASGQEVVLKVHATAGTPGNHVFRAEVRCKPLGSRLASEHTTYYYHHEPVARQAMR